MNVLDILIIAFRNLKSDKKNTWKILIEISCTFLLLNCFIFSYISMHFFLISYDKEREDYCYSYIRKEYMTSKEKRVDINAFLPLVKDAALSYDADDYIVYRDLNWSDESFPSYSKISILIDQNEYSYYKYISPEKGMENASVRRSDSFAMAYFHEEFNLISSDDFLLAGNVPETEGEVILDDYLLALYQIKDSPEELVGKTITISSDLGNFQRLVLEKYTISGVFSVKEFSNRKDSDLIQLHNEHLYLIPRCGEDLVVSQDEVRFRFHQYQTLSEHLSDITGVLGTRANDRKTTKLEEVFDSCEQLTLYGTQYVAFSIAFRTLRNIVIFIGIGFLLVVAVLLAYTLEFYFNRTWKYRKMLKWIGMNDCDIIRLGATEMVGFFAPSFLISFYLSILYEMFFCYAMRIMTDGFFSVSYTPFIMWILILLDMTLFLLYVGTFFVFSKKMKLSH